MNTQPDPDDQGLLRYQTAQPLTDQPHPDQPGPDRPHPDQPGPDQPGPDQLHLSGDPLQAGEPVAVAEPRHWGPSAVTIVWGVLLLAIAGLGVGYGLLDLAVDPFLLGALVVAGCGLFLVVVAAIGARRRTPAQPTAD